MGDQVEEPQTQQGIPGVGDLLLQMGGARPDHIRDMITTSTNVAESIPRARISRRDAKQRLRIRAKLNFVKNHEANVELLMWFEDAYSIAQDGEGRKEAVDMIIGTAMGMLRQGRLRNYRTMDRQEVAAG